MKRCSTCNGTDYIPAPPENSWRVFFEKTGQRHYNVLVPCPACGGIFGRANRERMYERLAARKAAGTFNAHQA